MKKLLTIVASLLIATSALADYITTAKMEVVASAPIVHKHRYTDYDTVENPLKGSTEVFCVEKVKTLVGVNDYDFYTIEGTSYNDASNKKLNQLKEASWYANWYLTESGRTDADKAIAQIAIWQVLEAMDGYKGRFEKAVSGLMSAYKDATNKDAFVSDWAVAVSPGDRSPIVWGEEGQNFLVNIRKNEISKNKIPQTPEPSTIVLFGMGLLGLAKISRKNT